MTNNRYTAWDRQGREITVTVPDDQCPTCAGECIWCGHHSTPEGCDCEDSARTIPCDECGGTGLRNDDE